MTTEITRKQAVLLSVLGVVLVVICFVQFLIRPMLTKASDAKAQIETLTQQYESLVQQSESYDQNMEALEGWNEKNSAETKKLFPLCESERVDRFLTFVMHECGVTVKSLSIGQTMQYYVDGEGNLIMADPETVAAAAEGADTASETDATAVAYTATGEYRCDFTYVMEGTYEDMTQMLNFVNRVSFLGITSYSFNSVENDSTENTENNGDEEKKLGDWYSFSMTITAYMYQSPLQTDTEAESKEADGAAEASDSTANV